MKKDAVWSIPHRGYCSSFLITYFRQKDAREALVTVRASQGGFGDLPALRPEQHRRRQEENSFRDEK